MTNQYNRATLVRRMFVERAVVEQLVMCASIGLFVIVGLSRPAMPNDTGNYLPVPTTKQLTMGAASTATEATAYDVEQSIGDAAHYAQTDAEKAAGVTPMDYLKKPGDIRRYGSISGRDGADTAEVQAAINQAIQPGGAPWKIPHGVTASVQTSGSTTSPVGAALTIAASSVGYIEGLLIGSNNAHLIRVTGDNVTVELTGSIRGFGGFFTGPNGGNGALFKNDGGNNVRFVGTGELIDPPQYAIWYRGAKAVGGRIGSFQISGGPTSLGGNEQHYGVMIDGLFSGLQIESFTVVPNELGGAVGQGLVSNSSLGRPDRISVASPTFRDTLDHSTYFFANHSTFGHITAIDCTTSTRLGGSGNSVVAITSRNSGGVEFQSWNNSSVGEITVIDYHGRPGGGAVGFNLQPRFGEATDGIISHNTFGPISLTGKAGDTTVRSAFRIRGVESSGKTETSQSDIVFEKLTIKDAVQGTTREGAIQIQVGAGKTFSRITLGSATIDRTGFQAVEIRGSGKLVHCDLDHVTVRNAYSATSKSR